MVMKFTNNATSTLASSITSIATSLTVDGGDGALFPTLTASDYFYCTLANSSGTIEIIKVTARSTDTFTITRAQDNTVASAFTVGDKVELRLVAASLNDLPKLDEANTFSAANTFSTTLGVTGVSTLTAGAVIQGLTVGKGAGAVATNTAVGASALQANTTGQYNTAIGYQANYSNTTANGSTAVGNTALYTNTGANNVGIGNNALYYNTTGTLNVAVGTQALQANTTASSNTAVGYQAIYTNTTGSGLTAVGKSALLSSTTGADNNAFGLEVLAANTTGYSNSAFGGAANFVAPAMRYNTTGYNNSAFGNGALAANTTGANNVAVGHTAMYAHTTGGSNVAVGQNSLQTSTTASNNTAIGYIALYSTTGNNNTAVGYSAGSSITTGTKNVILGSYTGAAAPISATASNHIVFSDGDGTVRGYFDNSGSGFFSGATVAYPGSGNTNTGIFLESAGQLSVSRANTVVARFNRNTSDGTLLSFARDGTEQGTISVSGGTVSYNAFAGSHWSQLSDGSKPDILRGTVLESINELIQWPDEPTTERLCKVKVSDTAGSKKVYGVFMDWDNDWTATNDMYVTAVGAFICRVNASVTVQEGDLLESNGDGTARVQADDIIRSSTIGKVTCTEKTHQYDDGSYCVPTVLYCG